MRILILTILLILTLSPAAFAGCYTREEAEAEQGIRIHSELMVIGLNCRHMQDEGGKDLYSAYNVFTAKHSAIFAGYEKRLMTHFQQEGAGDPEAKLNTLRTNFANKISGDAAKMRPDLFCQHYAGRIKKVGGMTGTDVRKWAATFFPSHPVSRPLCASN